MEMECETWSMAAPSGCSSAHQRKRGLEQTAEHGKMAGQLQQRGVCAPRRLIPDLYLYRSTIYWEHKHKNGVIFTCYVTFGMAKSALLSTPSY